MKSTFVLWSGGVDSTSMLKLLLEQSTDRIVAHYIRFDNPEGRREAEEAAIAELRWRLLQIRSFEFSQSSVSICEGKALAWDWSLGFAIGGPAMLHHGCTTLVRGRTLEDGWGRMGDGYVAYADGVQTSWNRFRETLRYILPPGMTPEEAAPWHWAYDMPKLWHWINLGELAPLTFSCRRPVNTHTPCGRCLTCQEVAAIKRGSSNNPEVARRIREAGGPNGISQR